MNNGLIEVYCGDGKGKTTASIGLGVRAIGAGLKVIMIQFLKSNTSSEISVLKTLEPNFKIFHFEKPRGFFCTLSDEEKAELKTEVETAMKFARKVIETEECDVLILDEILGVVENNLYSVDALAEFLSSKKDYTEIIMTGRIVPEEIKALSDYVSNIHKEKHPIDNNVDARKGIEF
ncbi:cob(I)yrinic acid a,c-diamide adenosyltransferase [Candidatus Epulonipiscium viviparus]|uniref:cob(I)yrinic acid a,c-diamide adenosyltransferase n=1 Tax=Candidatus Epulonipiscium viviparus TaxID=420336 RepID=UPI0027380951|nr:cob(I)yrinic acid a,c-diamide adenosyltransferase [Candidatus Epulopiscium viviparus]